MSLFAEWEITAQELEELIQANPSLRGMTFGYIAEYELRKLWFSDSRFGDLYKPDDHLRSKKGDLAFYYRGREVKVEVKSLQTNSVRREGNLIRGRFQCDASDRRKIELPKSKIVETTCLRVGEFDLLAVNLFVFGNGWQFAFAKNRDLPRTTNTKYTPQEQKYLLATQMEITLPLAPPFEAEPFRFLDEIISHKN
jgi:hypothetical protein